MMNAQVREALDRANQTREKRREVRRDVRAPRDYRASRHELARVLTDPIPAELNRLPVMTFLLWGWRFSYATAEKMLHIAGTSTIVRVGQLTRRQRIVLAVLLDGDRHTLADAELARELDLPPL